VTVGDYLSLIGELSIGVAGFSGVVAALTMRSVGEWRPVDVARLQMLLRTSVSAAIWSVLPALLLSSGFAGPLLWRAVSGAWLLIVPAVAVSQVRSVRNVLARKSEDASRGFTFLIATTSLAALALQVANVSAVAAPWPHLTTLALMLSISLGLFLRLAVLAFESRRPAV
jgi:hypothetical protein